MYFKIQQTRIETPKTGSGANAWVAGDDEEMQRVVPIEDVFKGRHFDRQIIVLCVTWYASFKLSLRDLRDRYHDPAVGAALPSRIRKALVALRSARRRIVEDGRDLCKGLRTMGVPVPRRRQSGSDGRFLSHPEPGRERPQIVSAYPNQ